MTYHSLSQQQSKNNLNTVKKKRKKEKKFYSTGCTDPSDENEDVSMAVTRVRLEIYWHKLLARKSFRQELLDLSSSQT